MSESDLAVHGLVAWAHLLIGLAGFLAPGLAAADRWLVGMPARWLWAPVLSFSLLSLLALFLGFAFSMQVQPSTTWLLAILLAAGIGRPRLVSLSRRLVGLPG